MIGEDLREKEEQDDVEEEEEEEEEGQEDEDLMRATQDCQWTRDTKPSSLNKAQKRRAANSIQWQIPI